MTLTIDLPDALAVAVKTNAENAGRTADSVVADVLRVYFGHFGNPESNSVPVTLMSKLSPILERVDQIEVRTPEAGLPWSKREGFD